MTAEPATIVGKLDGRVERFGVGQRAEHVVIMVTFIALMVTGLPQHFADGSWARWLILHFGGIDTTRLIHRFFALLFSLEAGYHVVWVVWALFRGRSRGSMIPTLQDARDAMAMIRYSFGLSETKPSYDRFSYRQKFEYWGVVFGTAIMIATGFVLAFPVFFTRFLPGEFVPAAKVIHGWEALLALSIIVIWHMYGTHFSPGKFPFDSSIFTGKIGRKEMLEEHPREYERLFGTVSEHSAGDPGGAPPAVTDESGVGQVADEPAPPAAPPSA